MIGRLDFSTSAPLLCALSAAVVLPVCLAVVARLGPRSPRHGLQFLIAAGLTTLGWALLSVVSGEPATPADVAVGAMVLAAILIVYLEAWALLCRGYTLGIILTLRRAGGSLDEATIAGRYRSGGGLTWIMQHRLSGLETARLVSVREGTVTLTPLAVVVARLYVTAVRLLGIRRSG